MQTDGAAERACFVFGVSFAIMLTRFLNPVIFLMRSLLTPERRWRMNVGNWGTAPKSNGTGVFHWLHRLGRKLIWRCPRGGPMPATQPSKELRALCHEHHAKMRLNRSHMNSD